MHLGQDPSYLDSVLLAKEAGEKIILVIHDLIPYDYPDLYEEKFLKNYLEYLFRILPLLDGILTVSQIVKDDVKRFFVLLTFPWGKKYAMIFLIVNPQKLSQEGKQMRDKELYQNFLGIVSPWSVDSVTMDVAKQRVDVTVSHPPKMLFSCPECGTESPVFDHAEERVWRHLDSCQFFTYRHARIPRISCSTHGVRQISVPWAEARGRFTKMFERLAIDVLKACDVSSAAAFFESVGTKPGESRKRAVERGLARKLEKPLVEIGVDEKAIAKGHQYMTLVCDLREGTIEYVGEGRKTETLNSFYATLSPEQNWDPGRVDGHVGAVLSIPSRASPRGLRKDRL